MPKTKTTLKEKETKTPEKKKRKTPEKKSKEVKETKKEIKKETKEVKEAPKQNTEVAKTPMVSLPTAYLQYWKQSFVWNARSTRAEYWWPVLVNALVITILTLFFQKSPTGTLFEGIFQLLTIIPGISVLVRRMHDVGHSTWLALSPTILAICLAVFSSLTAISQYAEDAAEPSLVYSLIFSIGGISLVILSIVVLIFCCMPGTREANKYGPAK